MKPTPKDPTPSTPTPSDEPTSPSESSETLNDLENVKEAWKEVYEQAQRPGEPPVGRG